MAYKDKADEKSWYQRIRSRFLAKMKQPESADHRRQVRRAHYAKNKVVVLSKIRAYQSANKDRASQWHRKGNADYRERLKNLVYDAYGNSCACCGETERAFLSVDHIGGGGRKHREEVGIGSSRMYRAIIESGFPKDKFRLLCMNCNFAIRFGSPCPHESEREYGISVAC